MKILVTGGTSIVGRTIVHCLISNGHDVIQIGRGTDPKWALGQDIPIGVAADCLVHLAHDRKLTLEQNMQAFQRIIASFDKRIIFLSSLSAHSRSKSTYGQSKYEGEQIFSSVGGSSLRAGLIVIGRNYSGVIAKLARLVEISRLIPIPFGGKPNLYFTRIEDLCAEILNEIQFGNSCVKFAAASTPIKLLNLCKTMQMHFGKRRYFLKISTALTNLLLSIFLWDLLRPTFIDSLLSMSIEVSDFEFANLEASSVTFDSPDFLSVVAD